MKINILALIIAFVLSGGFLAFVLTPPSFFNFLPLAIHQAMFRDVFAEKTFIVVFDIMVAVFFVWLFYKILIRFIPPVL